MKQPESQAMRDELRQTFEEWEVAPSDALWLRITDALDTPPPKIIPLPFWKTSLFQRSAFGIAACLLLMISFWRITAVDPIAPKITQDTPTTRAPKSVPLLQPKTEQTAPSTPETAQNTTQTPVPTLASSSNLGKPSVALSNPKPKIKEAIALNTHPREVKTREPEKVAVSFLNVPETRQTDANPPENGHWAFIATLANATLKTPEIRSTSKMVGVAVETEIIPLQTPVQITSASKWYVGMSASPAMTYQSMSPTLANSAFVAQNITPIETWSSNRLGGQAQLLVGRNIAKNVFMETGAVYHLQQQNVHYEIPVQTYLATKQADGAFAIEQQVQDYQNNEVQHAAGLQLALGWQAPVKPNRNTQPFIKFGGEMLWQFEEKQGLPAFVGSVGTKQLLGRYHVQSELFGRYQLRSQLDALRWVQVQPYQLGVRFSVLRNR